MFLSQTTQTMKKNSKNIKYVNKHVQMDGNANYDHWEKKGDQGDSFFFTPNTTETGAVASWRKRGTAQQMSDGTFEFVIKKDYRANATLIKKLAHGRVSETRDGAILLTVKVFLNENVNIPQTINEEAALACEALRNYTHKA